MPAARHPVIDFLQCDDVGIFCRANPRNALRIKLAIIANRLVDVVCENRDRQTGNLLLGQGQIPHCRVTENSWRLISSRQTSE